MPKTYFLLVLSSVTLSAVAQLLLKAGMSGQAVQRALFEADTLKTVVAISGNMAVLAGLALYFGSALVWLVVLSKVDVSVAYPLVAIGFVLTAVFGHILFGEILTAQRIAGILLVCAGVAVLARG